MLTASLRFSYLRGYEWVWGSDLLTGIILSPTLRIPIASWWDIVILNHLWNVYIRQQLFPNQQPCRGVAVALFPGPAQLSVIYHSYVRVADLLITVNWYMHAITSPKALLVASLSVFISTPDGRESWAGPGNNVHLVRLLLLMYVSIYVSHCQYFYDTRINCPKIWIRTNHLVIALRYSTKV